jgi:hypothetical protein
MKGKVKWFEQQKALASFKPKKVVMYLFTTQELLRMVSNVLTKVRR